MTRPLRPWRRWGTVAGAVVVALSVATTEIPGRPAGPVAGPKARPAALRVVGVGAPGKGPKAALTGSTPLPADCVPNPAGPPGSFYQLGLVGTVHGGVLTAGLTAVDNINATFCGIVTVVNSPSKTMCPVTGSVTSPFDGQVYGPLNVAIDLVPGTSVSIGFTANPGTITGTFACTPSSEEGLSVTLDATVSGTTAPLFGVSCTIGPFTIPLTGTVTGPLDNLTTTLSSSDFTIPTVQSSPTCPGALPANVDAIAGLPMAPGGASISLPVTASLYQPADQP
ncbi:MAG TPA: hypothetical protein VMF60_07405 [Acidimicrobiales bacterium]|nr:hypothetical protein [Acidimicrobiales bacterium]